MKQSKNSFTVVLETAEPTDKSLIKFLRDNQIKNKVIEKASKSHSGFDEIEYTAGSKAALESLIDQFYHDDSLKDGIE